MMLDADIDADRADGVFRCYAMPIAARYHMLHAAAAADATLLPSRHLRRGATAPRRVIKIRRYASSDAMRWLMRCRYARRMMLLDATFMLLLLPLCLMLP